MDALYEVLQADKDTFRYVRRDNHQIQAVAVTPGLGYNNDLIFQARNNPERIEIYGTARISVGDFGANREYLEGIRQRLREEHVLK
ncbi:DUF1499 domain-containing protein [Cerasicoccus maritimus]|uniref:DUF1499 domain-containing protein n=1 Tax=Cerasicoccus maritimus TaxID=490089 RepID=UPI003CCD0C18